MAVARCAFLWAQLVSVTVAYNASKYTRRVSVSGQSAGGSMAIQHLFVHSSLVDGATVAAGSPYGCGMLPYEYYYYTCAYGKPDVKFLDKYIQKQFGQGLIDDPANLKHTPVVLFNGKNDWTVYVKEMRTVQEQLEKYVDSDLIHPVFNTNAAHVWSKDNGKCECGACRYYWIKGVCCDVNNCHYDLSGDMLSRFYGRLQPRAKANPTLHWVDQWSYISDLPKTADSHASMMKWALVYLPSSCKAEPHTCRVHVNYHGCTPRLWNQRRMWVLNLDLNEYGESNGIIMVYPQAHGIKGVGAGCWNWLRVHGDPNFDTNKGAQLHTVMNMVEDLPNALKQAIVVNNDDPVPTDDSAEEALLV